MNLSNTLIHAASIEGWMEIDELVWLYETASVLGPGSNIVEIGAFCGRSAFAIAMAMPAGSSLMTIDSYVPEHWIPHDDLVLRVRQHEIPMLCAKALHSASMERGDCSISLALSGSALAASKTADGSVDMLFIDGDHSGPALEADIAHWKPKMKSGGIMCGHDYGNAYYPAIKPIIDRLGGHKAAGSIWVIP